MPRKTYFLPGRGARCQRGVRIIGSHRWQSRGLTANLARRSKRSAAPRIEIACLPPVRLGRSGARLRGGGACTMVGNMLEYATMYRAYNFYFYSFSQPPAEGTS